MGFWSLAFLGDSSTPLPTCGKWLKGGRLWAGRGEQASGGQQGLWPGCLGVTRARRWERTWGRRWPCRREKGGLVAEGSRKVGRAVSCLWNACGGVMGWSPGRAGC